MSLVFLFGVLIFSVTLSNFIHILEKVILINSDLEEGDSLRLFFLLFKRYNGGKKINKEIIEKIEKYFEYRWNNDKLMAIDDKNEMAILTQLPEPV